MRTIPTTHVRRLVAGILLLLVLAQVTPTHAAGYGAIAAVTGTDGQLYALGGSGYVPLGGNVVGAPALVAGQRSDLSFAVFYIVTRSSDHTLWYRTASDPWQPLTTAPTYCVDGPAAASYYTYSDHSYHLFVTCTGGDHQVYYAQTQFPLTPAHLITSWQAIGGFTNYSPAVVTTFMCWIVNGQKSCWGVPVVFAVGADHALYSQGLVLNGSWRRLGGWCAGHPGAAYILGQGTTYLACQGADRALWYTTSKDDFTWSGLTSLGGAMLDGPAIGSVQIGDLGYFPVFVAEGADTAVYENDGRSPLNWANMGGSAGSGPGAYAVPLAL